MTDRTWTAITREAGIAAEHMGSGATTLGRANYAHHAHYGQAFFDLSIGFERACKLALVVDHAIDNAGSFPSNNSVKKYGHNLKDLLGKADNVAEKRGYKGNSRLPRTPIHESAISILSDFATNITRYYNIDLITSAPRASSASDPISEWFERVRMPVLEKHVSGERIGQVERNARAADSLFGEMAYVAHTSESGSALDSIYSASRQTGITELAQPYERMYVLQIVRFLGLTLSDLGRDAHSAGVYSVPYLSEFFAIFNNSDSYFKQRKTWSIYRP